MQADHCAGGDRRADGDRARIGVRAEHSAHEEVALLVLGLAAADDDAEQQPAGHEGLLSGWSSRSPLERVEGRPPRELVDDVPLGRGDGQLRADRRRALRDARHHLDAREGEADSAVAAQLVAQEEGSVAVEGARAGDAPEDRDAGARRDSSPSTRSVGNE